MGVDCCVPECGNSDQTGGDITFYPFPTDAACRQRWLEFIGHHTGRYRWRSKRICSHHFRPTDIAEYMGKRTLVNGALPVALPCRELSPCDYDKIIAAETIDRARAASVDTSETEALQPALIDIRALYCRICLLRVVGLQPLERNLMAEKVRLVTGIDVGLDELAPTYACGDCANKLKMVINIRKEILKTNEHLINVLAQVRPTIKSSMVAGSFLSQMEKSFPEALMHLVQKQEMDATATVMPKEEEMTVMVDEGQEDDNESGKYIEEVERESPVVPLLDVCRLEIVKTEENEEETDEEFLDEAITSTSPQRLQKHPDAVALVPHTCYICSPFTFYENKDELEEHFSSHSSLLPVTCDDCHRPEFPKIFNTFPALNRHLRSHQYSYQCKECPARFQVSSSLIHHRKDVHKHEQEDGYTCDTCGEQFTRYGAMRNHMRLHRIRKSGRYRCDVCGTVLSNATTLRRHQRIHTGEKPFQCKLCGRCFNHEHNFAIHKRMHTGEKKYNCDMCDKSFINSTLLKYHMGEHYPDDPQYRKGRRPKPEKENEQQRKKEAEQYEKVYLCPEPGCGHTSTVYAKAFYHRKKHATPFQCSQCERSFSFVSELRRHVDIKHEGKRPAKKFPCTRCGKAFDNRQKLAVHIDAHENNRKYKCRYCDMAFVQKANCMAHERRHTGQQPFKCRTCQLQFSNTVTRKQHEQTVHGGVLQNVALSVTLNKNSEQPKIPQASVDYVIEYVNASQ